MDWNAIIGCVIFYIGIMWVLDPLDVEKKIKKFFFGPEIQILLKFLFVQLQKIHQNLQVPLNIQKLNIIIHK